MKRSIANSALLSQFLAQLAHLIRVPSHESDRRDIQHSQDLGGQRVGARILAVAQLHIRLEGIESGILQFVRLQFLVQTDPAAFLPQVDEDSPLAREAGPGLPGLLFSITTPSAHHVPPSPPSPDPPLPRSCVTP